MTQRIDKTLPKVIWLILWVIIFADAFVWRTQNLEAFGLSNDEGAHLMWAKLAVEGYPLYQETYAVQAPLFLEPVGWAFAWFGPTIQAGRWPTLLGFTLLCVALSWLAYRSGGWVGAIITVFLIGLSPLIFTFSRLVMAEVPATALAVVSVALALHYFEQGRHKGWLFVSGLVLGASFITKALNPFVVVPVGLLLVWYYGWRQVTPRVQANNMLIQLQHHWPALALDVLLWTIGVALPLIAILIIYGPANIYDQLIAFRGDLRTVRPGSWPETWGHFKLFFTNHWGFCLLVIGSIISSVLYLIKFGGFSYQLASSQYSAVSSQNLVGDESKIQNPESPSLNLIWISWLAAGIIMLMWHTPLFPHHFIVLLPPLVLLGATFPANFVALWPEQQQRHYRVWARVIVVGLIAVALFNIPAMVEANQKTAAITTGGREQDALKLLDAVSQPADFVMGDSQLLIFMANRHTPPPLGDVALVAIQSGRQNSPRMIDLTEQYQSPAVVQWSLRLPWLPDYLAWVEANYLTKKVWDNDHIIYYGRRIPTGEALPNARNTALGESITLRGFDLDGDSGPAGQDLVLNVSWHTDAPLEQDYTVFTQLLDGSGALVASSDSQPLSGYFPTSQWPVNQIITDMVRLPLPDNLPAGTYTLITGMYQLDTLERLTVGDSPDNYITVTTVALP